MSDEAIAREWTKDDDEPSPSPGPIALLIGDLHEAVDAAHRALTDLERRIGPILTEHATPGPETGVAVRVVGSPIGTQLAELLDRVRALRDRTADVHSKVDL